MGKKTLAACADACRGKSSMFVYGTGWRCDTDEQGCECYCETASRDEECTGSIKEHEKFNLFAFHTRGKCISVL